MILEIMIPEKRALCPRPAAHLVEVHTIIENAYFPIALTGLRGHEYITMGAFGMHHLSQS